MAGASFRSDKHKSNDGDSDRDRGAIRAREHCWGATPGVTNRENKSIKLTDRSHVAAFVKFSASATALKYLRWRNSIDRTLWTRVFALNLAARFCLEAASMQRTQRIQRSFA